VGCGDQGRRPRGVRAGPPTEHPTDPPAERRRGRDGRRRRAPDPSTATQVGRRDSRHRTCCSEEPEHSRVRRRLSLASNSRHSLSAGPVGRQDLALLYSGRPRQLAGPSPHSRRSAVARGRVVVRPVRRTRVFDQVRRRVVGATRETSIQVPGPTARGFFHASAMDRRARRTATPSWADPWGMA